MKIAFIVRSFPALSETFILNQVIGLLDRGHRVDIYSIYRGNTSNVHPEYEKYNIYAKTLYLPNVPHNPILRILKAIWLLLINGNRIFAIAKSLNVIKYGRAAKLLYLFYFSIFLKETKEYDMIHCHFGICGLVGVGLRDLQLISGKIITSFHGMDINVYPKLYGSNVYNKLFERADLYTVNSKFLSRKLENIGCYQSKIIRLPVGTDTNKYYPVKKNQVSERKIKILTIARLVECKGLEYSIKAIVKIKEQYSNICYQIVGEGEYRKTLETLLDELEVKKYIKLLGAKNQDQILNLYTQSDIFMLPSVVASDGSEEAQGIVLQEAQAMKLPIISTRIGGIPEGMLDGKSGFLVPEKDVDALAERLGYLLEHPEIWAEMGQAGRDFVEKNYDLNMLNNRLVKIYQNLLTN